MITAIGIVGVLLLSGGGMYWVAELVSARILPEYTCPRCGAALPRVKPPYIARLRRADHGVTCGSCHSLLRWQNQRYRILIIGLITVPVWVVGIEVWFASQALVDWAFILLVTTAVYFAADRLTVVMSRLRYVSSLREASQKSSLSWAGNAAQGAYYPGHNGDVLEEASRRLGQGHLRGAEDLLRAAIRAEQERVDLKVALLNAYLKAKELERFDRQLAPWRDQLKNSAAREELRQLLDERRALEPVPNDPPEGG